ncbi:MAG TPA: nucleotidyl transferase AbiEii/AbiGii toxin family protein [Membranihabitans sp.]|nr:nucleotidyl transferase AbiEii/AbiGii toxin family protein [Membranihabitans sp.]
MLHTETIPPGTLSLLKELQQSEILKNCPLAGGTALALQLGHRISVDLDLFSLDNLNLEEVKRFLESYPESLELSSSKSIVTYSIKRIKVDVVNYDYPPINPLIIESGILLYSLEDIAAMKLEAIKGRGRKRDFYDLYFLLQEFTLEEILQFNLKKYNVRNPFMILKSLSYFEDAEVDPDVKVPPGVYRIEWDQVKNGIIEAGKNYL